MTKKRFLAVLVVLALSCAMLFAAKQAKPIVVLYTNDVHCGYVDNCGYSGLAAVKAQYEEEYGEDYVTLVDNGDAIQGTAIGTVSYGQYIVDLMNAVGYDFAIFGNHEFDYNLDRLAAVIKRMNAQYLACNIVYKGTFGSNKLFGSKPYKIVKYGPVKVAYIGVATPESVVKSTPKYFMDANGNYIYEFKDGEDMYETVQKYVDKVRKKGADYVVVLAHLGIEEDSAPNRSTDLIANTTGIDVLLDGHSHSTVECDLIKNKDGKDVIYSQTGTKLKNIGVLTIDPNENKIETRLIQTTEHDKEVDAVIEKIDGEYKAAMQAVVAHSDIELTIRNEDGFRAVRNRETIIGDLCADAYRAVAGSDVAFVNGGGIRADIKAGDLNTENILAVHPYGNMLCMCEATGQQILDALEHGSKNTQAKTDDGKNALGESGGFLQVSGLKYTIDTSVPSSVRTDSKGMFISVDGPRRVKDVFVGSEESGWEKIDPEKTYKVSCHDYLLQDMGDGYTMFAKDKYLINKAMIDNQVLITYIRDFLGGNISAKQYGAVKGRITVI